jgi:hypothetical protein
VADEDIANMALAHIGAAGSISDLDTDTNEESVVINRFLTKAREQMLRSHDWSFATKTATLSDQTEEPNEEWSYGYRYPSDCIKARRIFTGEDRVPTPGAAIPFKIANNTTTTSISAATAANPVVLTVASTEHLFNGDQIIISGVAGMTNLNGNTYTVASKATTTITLSGTDGSAYSAYTSGGTVTLTSYSALAIYTDEDDAVLEYTFSATDTTYYPADFELALSYLLAFYIAPKLSRGDLFGMQQRMMQLYQEAWQIALVNDSRERRKDPPADAEWIRDR